MLNKEIKEDIDDQLDLLVSDYQNSFGGFKSNPGYDTGNPHLYTAYCLMVASFYSSIPTELIDSAKNLYSNTKVADGLNARHPLSSDRYKNSVDVLSHDETTGMAAYFMLLDRRNPKGFKAIDLYYYGSSNEWMYIEQFPYTTRKKYKKQYSTWKLWKQTVKYFYQLAINKIDEEVIDKNYHPAVFGIRYRRRWRDRAVIALAAGLNPKIHWKIALCVHTVISGIKLDYKYANGTSILLTWLRGRVNQKSICKSWLVDIADSFFLWRARNCNELDKSYWLNSLFKLHFGPDHPISKITYYYATEKR